MMTAMMMMTNDNFNDDNYNDDEDLNDYDDDDNDDDDVFLASYLWSWTPYTVVNVWAIIGESRDIPVYIITIPAVVAKSSCIWDPLIYLWTNRQFRIAFYKTMPCKSLGEKLLQRDELKHKEMESSQPQQPQELRHKSNRLTPLRQTTTKQGPAVSVSEYGQKTETMGVSQINVPHVVVQGPSKIGNVC